MGSRRSVPRAAEVPAEKADLLHAIYDRIIVAGRRIVTVRLTPAAYAHGLALALPEKVEMARPTGGAQAHGAHKGPRGCLPFQNEERAHTGRLTRGRTPLDALIGARKMRPR